MLSEVDPRCQAEYRYIKPGAEVGHKEHGQGVALSAAWLKPWATSGGNLMVTVVYFFALRESKEVHCRDLSESKTPTPTPAERAAEVLREAERKLEKHTRMQTLLCDGVDLRVTSALACIRQAFALLEGQDG